jgi:hypothetical protein
MDREKDDAATVFLRDEVEQTRALYESAKEVYERARRNCAPNQALSRAESVKAFTMDLYRRALSDFNQRVLRTADCRAPYRKQPRAAYN